MIQRKIKSYVTGEGRVLLVDPGLEHLPLIRKLNPQFRMKMSWPPHDFVPNLTKTRATRTGLPMQALSEADDDELWELHSHGMKGTFRGGNNSSANLLDIKVELARRELLDCRLCGHLCGINRFLKPGRCGLKDKAYTLPPFLHIGEEAVITPAATLKLYNCALDCEGCQSWESIQRADNTMPNPRLTLDGTVWNKCKNFKKAAAIELVGGNPDESVYAILKTLVDLPSELSSKPIVWNTHGYGSKVIWDLLEGIVDIYLPDFKGCDECVEKISKVKGYWSSVTEAIESMVGQDARVIVRILVLPGHVFCCHKPALQWLAKYKDRLWISPIEFIPDYRALGSSELNRQTSEGEMDEVKRIMKSLKLRGVEEEPDEFWKGAYLEN